VTGWPETWAAWKTSMAISSAASVCRTGVLNHAEVQQLDVLRSSPESVSPRSPGGFRMIPVPATVPADVVFRTINFQDDYSFFPFLVSIHHSTIRPLTCDYLSANRQRRTESAPRATFAGSATGAYCPELGPSSHGS
jgi:hypothetical protein